MEVLLRSGSIVWHVAGYGGCLFYMSVDDHVIVLVCDNCSHGVATVSLKIYFMSIAEGQSDVVNNHMRKHIYQNSVTCPPASKFIIHY